MPDENLGFDNWMDAQLRGVPVPAELLSRLSAQGPSRGREVLLDPLRPARQPSRWRLGGRLQAVACPRGCPWSWSACLAAGLIVLFGVSVLGYRLAAPAKTPSRPQYAPSHFGRTPAPIYRGVYDPHGDAHQTRGVSSAADEY